MHVWIAAALEGHKTQSKEKDKAKEKDKFKEMSVKEFRNAVQAALGDAWAGLKRPFNFLTAKKDTVPGKTRESIDGKPITTADFEAVIVQELNVHPKEFLWQFYFHVKVQHQIAVVFQVPKDKAHINDITTAIDLSLKSLDIGPDADKRRAAYLKYRR